MNASRAATRSNRRRFLQASASVTAATLAAPTILTAKRTDSDTIVTGDGDYQYSVDHHFLELPDRFHWQTTHNVAVDSNNNLYVIHEGRKHLKDHPSVFVFDPDGKFLRAFGSQFQGGGHGIDIRKEGTDEFLYVAAYQGVKSFAKLTLVGDTVWYRKAPMESGKYAEGEDLSTKPNWSRKGFLPTNFAFLDNGGFLLADGYGTHCIHEFDKDGKWKRVFGGTGEGEGKFNLCHGLTIDQREGRKPSILVTDRAHNTLQYLTMDGEYIETMVDYGLPANAETRGPLLLIPELRARVSLLNEKNEIVARLGTGTERLDAVKNLRSRPEEWVDGQFVHPHDACFDQQGNIFVAEWVQTGRVSRLTRIR